MKRCVAANATLLAVTASIVFPFHYLPAGGSSIGRLAVYAPTGLLGAAFGVYLFSKEGRRELCRITRDNPASGHLITYWGIVFFGSLGAQEPMHSIPRAVYYLAGLIPFLVMQESTLNRSHAERFTTWLAGVGVVVGLFSCLEFVLNWNPLSARFFSAENPAYWDLTQHDAFSGRVLGPIGHPVILGSVLVMLLPLAVWCCRQSTRWIWSLLWGAGAIFILAAMFLTYSRGAWVSLGVGLIALSTARWGRRQAMWGLLAAMALGMALVLSSERVQVTLRSRDPIAEYIDGFAKHGRVQAYGQVAQIVVRQPLLGLGFGGYRLLVRDDDKLLDSPDNMYLLWLAESGTLGLIAGAGALLSVLRAVGMQRENDRLSSVLHASLCAFCTNLLIADLLHIPATRLLFWCTAGLGLLAARTGGPSAPSEGGMLR